jgi:hypothetical protein
MQLWFNRADEGVVVACVIFEAFINTEGALDDVLMELARRRDMM